jgi:hypothetical protein
MGRKQFDRYAALMPDGYSLERRGTSSGYNIRNPSGARILKFTLYEVRNWIKLMKQG